MHGDADQPPSVYYVDRKSKLPEQLEEQDSNTTDALEDAGEHAVADRDGRIWKWKGDETMHPYWAVRRIAVAQLKEEVDKTMPFNKVGYNLHLVTQTYNVVGVGSFTSDTLSVTFEVVINMFSNTDEMVEGEELVFESAAKKVKKEKRKEIWKDDVAKEKKAKAKGEEKPVANVNPTKEKMKDIEI